MKHEFPGDGMLLVDNRGVITCIDRSVAQALRVLPEKVRGRKLTEVFPETRLLEVLTSHQVLTQELMISKQKIALHYCPICKEEEFLGVALYCHADLSTEMQIETDNAQVNMLLSLYEHILEDLPLGISIVDRQGRIVMLNREYRETLGITDPTVRGIAISKIVPFSRARDVLRTGQPILETDIKFQGCSFFLSEAPIYCEKELIGGLSKVLNRERLEKYNVKELFDRFQLLESKLLFYKEELQELRRMSSPLEEIIGDTPVMKQIKRVAARVALHDANVLITGESGTGKGLIAQAIHNLSQRSNEPFIKINCAAIPDNLLEAELFGYEEGAFTGAVKGGKPGKFELADGGTIFLDEIGDMPAAMQAKILRALQEKSFERVGGHKTLNVNVRVLAATHRDLQKEIEEGSFRLDLYYRLAVINLHIPPLRERKADIPKVAENIVAKLSHKYVQKINGLSPDVYSLFEGNTWPGNIRELENVLEYAFNFLDPEEDEIRLEHLPGNFINSQPIPRATTVLSSGINTPSSRITISLDQAVAQAEIDSIIQALKLSEGNKQEAARILGIHVSGLYQKLKKYNITGH